MNGGMVRQLVHSPAGELTGISVGEGNRTKQVKLGMFRKEKITNTFRARLRFISPANTN